MKPVLDAGGMADYLTGMSQLERAQVLELWRLQQFEAGRRASEDARRRYLEEQHQFAAGHRAGRREAIEEGTQTGCARCGEPPFAIQHIFHFAPYPAAHKFVAD